MSQILVQVSAQMLEDLERVVPGASRKRSRFIRLAIQRALMEVEDAGTRAAYETSPVDEAPAFDASSWGEWKPKPAQTRGKKRAATKRR